MMRQQLRARRNTPYRTLKKTICIGHQTKLEYLGKNFRNTLSTRKDESNENYF